MAHDGAQRRSQETERARLICLVAAERAQELLPVLREHFAREPLIEVVVERRAPSDGRVPREPVGQPHRRAPVAERDPARSLPPELRHEAADLRLVQPMEPLRRTHEDADMADLVNRTLAVEPEAVSELWWRVSERMHARLTLRLGPLAADRAARVLLGRMLDELPTYEPEYEAFTAWLDAVVDHYAQERTERVRSNRFADRYPPPA